MPGPALTLELLHPSPTEPDLEAVAEVVRRTLPGSRLGEPADEPGATRLIAHEDFGTVIADGTRVPVFTAITPSPQLHVIEREHDFSQTWGWPQARAEVARATACVAVTEVMGHLHAPADRLKAFRSVVELVAATDPLALWCPNLTKFVPPGHADGLEAFINVRLFRVENGERDGEMVMDSLGLHAFDLPDVQCHFAGIDPDVMSRVLYDTAAYVLENGDVIEDGNTVPGPEGDERWSCRHEAALIGPERVVLDIRPDVPHAAGSRDASGGGRRGIFKRRRR